MEPKHYTYLYNFREGSPMPELKADEIILKTDTLNNVLRIETTIEKALKEYKDLANYYNQADGDYVIDQISGVYYTMEREIGESVSDDPRRHPERRTKHGNTRNKRYYLCRTRKSV